MTTIKKFFSFLPWLVVFEGISMLIGSFASPNPGNPQIQNWYAGLIKSPLNPPAFIFPLAWTILYGLIAYALWRVWSLGNNRPPHNDLTTFKIWAPDFWAFAIGHMLLNWSWSYAFFASQNATLGFIWLLAVWLSAIVLAVWIKRYDRFAAVMLLPYLAWLTFAVYLNGFIVWAN